MPRNPQQFQVFRVISCLILVYLLSYPHSLEELKSKVSYLHNSLKEHNQTSN